MESLVYRVRLRLIKALNVVLMTLPVVICWQMRYSQLTAGVGKMWTTILLVAVFVALYVTYGRIYDSFYVSLLRISEMIYNQVIALLMSDLWMYVIISLTVGNPIIVLPIAATFVVQLIFSVIWCTTAHIWYFKKYPAKKTAIIYDRWKDLEGLIGEYGLTKKFDIRSTVPVQICIDEKFEPLDGIEVVFLCGIHSHERNQILKYCVDKNIMVYVLPRVGDIIMSGASRMHLFHLPFLRVGRYEPAPEYLSLKRVFDIAASLFAMIVCAPIMLVTAAAIKIQDGGPVLYRQKRLTQNGRVFELLKFRSMRQDAEKDGIARLSTGEYDSRITPVGRIIRRMRIDELPQLFNILAGDMSIVGPRPERPEIAQQYEQDLPEFSLRLQAKAGLTGYAQVYGKYNTTPYDKLQMDLMYIAHPSLLEDIRIIFATIKILFVPESTEGVPEGMETAIEKTAEKRDVIEV